MIVVVDASVAAKWYLSEMHVNEAEMLLDGKFELHAPEIAIPELGNILWQKVRVGDISAEDSLKVIGAFAKQEILFHPQILLIKEAVRGANATGQSVYDWVYLALAISLACPFITADRRFYLAMRNTPFTKQIVWVEKIPDLI